MKILINALSAKLGGGQTYLINLLRNIPADFPHEIIFLCGTFNVEKFRHVAPENVVFEVKDEWARNSLYRTLWELFCLPGQLKRGRVDVYFQPAAGVPIPIPKGCRSATMLRNMLPFEDRERKRFPLFSRVRLKMAIQKKMILFSLARYHRVVFISRYSQQFIKRFLPDIEKKSLVVPHGLNEQFLNRSGDFDVARFGLQADQFYLYVSILDYYKAQLELLREWKLLVDAGFPYPLVLTGFLDRADYTAKIRSEIERLGLARWVILTGPVPNAELPGYYQKARALIFASSCECCPNILLEKMSAGKPLFCSNIQPMPEFGGDAPYYFDPYTPGELAACVMAAEQNDADRAIHAAKAEQNAAKYNWNKTITTTLRYITSE